MESIKTLLEYKVKPDSRSERAALLDIIRNEINLERRGTVYKQLTPKIIAIKLAHIPTKDLYYLKGEAYDYQERKGSFSKYIFGAIKAAAPWAQSKTIEIFVQCLKRKKRI